MKAEMVKSGTLDKEPIGRDKMLPNVIYRVVEGSNFGAHGFEPQYAWLVRKASNDTYFIMTDVGIVYEFGYNCWIGKFVPTALTSITIQFTME